MDDRFRGKLVSFTRNRYHESLNLFEYQHTTVFRVSRQRSCCFKRSYQPELIAIVYEQRDESTIQGKPLFRKALSVRSANKRVPR